MNIEALNAAIAQEFEIDVQDITPDACIRDTLELDSLSLLDLVAVVGKVTGIPVKGMEVKEIPTFGALYRFLEAQEKAA